MNVINLLEPVSDTYIYVLIILIFIFLTFCVFLTKRSDITNNNTLKLEEKIHIDSSCKVSVVSYDGVKIVVASNKNSVSLIKLESMKC